ncbi:hypothetical protein LB523_21250 [Mesorhizobium sp. ESP-6-4]|uniref:hypothetical protein n=1 Tax=Mesorhizobium sp. ESP-6-4 TaxID=2876624 RepID=UPI001CC90B0B|nr:hypothetical protein [Mesorhizobium sp. ESP-6-4]MBZ9661576.1 hypothetical protein [Mesorhizobium sp. ESP-6-4]
MGDTPISNIPEPGPKPQVSTWDAIRSAFVSQDAISDEFADMMNEIEAQRKRDFGRDFDD